MSAFSSAQSKSIPMKLRMKLKLERVQSIGSQQSKSEKMSSSGLKSKKKSTEAEEQKPAVLKRTVSPKLKDLKDQSWNVGRGKGGRKLSLTASLVKSKSE